MAAALFNQQSTAMQPLLGRTAAPMANSATGKDGSTDSAPQTGSATISANDFLTLLVTEMRNQDPTAQTDPNEYINQLVAVNSLEQLININQTLTGALGNTETSNATSTDTSTDSNEDPSPQTAGSKRSSFAAGVIAERGSMGSRTAPAVQPGNLGIPVPSAAADRVAHALDGRR